MDNIFVTSTIILGELSLILIAIIAGGVYYIQRQKNEEQTAIADIVTHFDKQEDARTTLICSALSEDYHYSEEEANEAAKEILETEKVFTTYLMNTLLQHDNAELGNLHKHLDEVAAPYRKLLQEQYQEMASAQAMEDENQRLREALLGTQQTLDNVQDELKTTKEDMDSTIQEFSSAFYKGQSPENGEEPAKKGDNKDAKAKTPTDSDDKPTEKADHAITDTPEPKPESEPKTEAKSEPEPVSDKTPKEMAAPESTAEDAPIAAPTPADSIIEAEPENTAPPDESANDATGDEALDFPSFDLSEDEKTNTPAEASEPESANTSTDDTETDTKKETPNAAKQPAIDFDEDDSVDSLLEKL